MKKHNYSSTTIAILPFDSISSDNSLNYFAIGFTEDLITDLSRFSSLQVISSHSTGAFRDEHETNEKLIQSFKVDYLVRGSFRQKGNDIRINTQLISTGENSIIWSHRYEADINSIFEIQDDATEQLVSALQREIEVNLLTTSKSKPLTILEAYECWLMGMEQLKKGTLDSDNNARELFQQALKIDPNYARAYAGLSQTYFNEWTCQFWERWDYSQKGAFEYAQKAIELDETNYISLTVLGRLYVYKGEWEKAEHFLRKSLRINPNDTDNIIQIASCFIYLGYLKEAEKLYLKAMRLNPINTDWYYSFGAMLYFEIGDFKKCIELGLKTDLNTVMVDMAAFMAGAYYHIKDYENMTKLWGKYLEVFQKKILKGNELFEEEALKWIVNVNPCKNGSNMTPFVGYISKRIGVAFNSTSEEGTQGLISENLFRKNGQLWEMTFDDHSIMMPDAKGLHDILRLISTPNQEIHCTELMGVLVDIGNDSFMLDEKAKKEYRLKLQNLLSDIEEAQLMNDHVRAGHLQEEYDQLLDHLSQSMGLGGKSRKLPAPIDKARSAVTWRIRSAIKKITEVHAALGTHLTKSIKTGTFCSYVPDKKVEWEL